MNELNNNLEINEELIFIKTEDLSPEVTKDKIKVTKNCKSCNKELQLKYFSAAKRNKDGLKNNCKKCDKQTNKKYYKGHREEKINKTKEWQKKNRDKYFNYQLKYRVADSEEQ